MTILHLQNQQFFNRLFTKQTSIAATLYDSGRSNYRTPGAVPFQWEAAPGKPKDSMDEQATPPLSLPPIRRVNLPKKTPSTSFVVPRSPRSLTGKMKSLLNSRFLNSQRLGCHENPMDLHSHCDNPQLDSNHSFRLGLKKSSSVRSELMGDHQRFDFVLEMNFGSKSQEVRGGNKLSMSKMKVKDRKSRNSDQGCSPRSTLEYTTDRSFSSSASSSSSSSSTCSSSSPFYFSPSTSYASLNTSLNRDLPSLSPCSSMGQESSSNTSDYGSNAPGSTVARAILANWSRSLNSNTDPDPNPPFNCPFPSANSNKRKSHSGPQPFCVSSSLNKSCSGPQPRSSRSNYVAPHRIYSGQAKFFSGPQKNLIDPQKSFSSRNPLAMQDPTCSALDQLFPLKRVESSLLTQVQRKDSNIKGDREEGKPNTNKREMEKENHKERGNGSVRRPQEAVESDDDDANISAFSPVSSAFVFAHYNETSASNRHDSNAVSLEAEQKSSSLGSLSTPDFISLHMQTRTAFNKEADPKASSIASFSSNEVLPLHLSTEHTAEQTSAQLEVVARVGSQKISGVLLRQVVQVEEEMHNQRHKSKSLRIMGPCCWPICAFFGTRSKVGSQRHSLDHI